MEEVGKRPAVFELSEEKLQSLSAELNGLEKWSVLNQVTTSLSHLLTV